ncbi:hypothetical protein JCM11251_007324 [Rhodosporidiobolus azoricus]
MLVPRARREAVSCSTLLLASFAAAQSVPVELFSQETYFKVLSTANSSEAPSTWPEFTTSDGRWSSQPETDWTSAFFPVSLFLLHERSLLCPQDTVDTDWLALARSWSAALYSPSEEVVSSWTHDIGFNSLPELYELHFNPSNGTARRSLLDNANALASRFSSVVGCTRSWDRGEGDFEVIIDNMANLQLLVAASRLASKSTFLDMAASHAEKTMQNHVRSDGSSFHVVDYSPTTGDVQWQGTAQGLANSSTWSRGQAWGALGFALMANATGRTDFLETSRRMASFFVNHLPSEGVSYWDFNATPPTTLDTSASNIMASTLLLLSSFESSLGNNTAAKIWSDSALTLLSNVVEQGVTEWRGESIVGNGTVNNRANPPNNNTGIVYGDTYFLQSGNYLLKLGLANCSDGSTAQGASPSALSSSLLTNSSSSVSTPDGSNTGGDTEGGSGGDGNSGGGNACRRTKGSPSPVFRLASKVVRRLSASR